MGDEQEDGRRGSGIMHMNGKSDRRQVVQDEKVKEEAEEGLPFKRGIGYVDQIIVTKSSVEVFEVMDRM